MIMHISRCLSFLAGAGLLAACSSDPGSSAQGQAGSTGLLSGMGGAGASPTGPSAGGMAPIGQGGTPVGAGGSVGVTGGATGIAGSVGAGGSAVGGATSAGGAGMGGAGVGGTTGGGGTNSGGASGGGGAGGAVQGDKPPCLKDASQIVLIGDSYVNWGTHTFPQDINAASMLNIQDFAVGGTSMGSGGIGLIPPQFDTALQTHPDIRVVIMDGGGNDILLPNVAMYPNGSQCKNAGAMGPMIPDCVKIVQAALDAGQKLFLHMADKGVKDAIYFFYPHVPLNTALGGTDPNGMLDYSLPKIQAECEGAYDTSIKANPQKPIRCHFVNLVPVFEGHMDYFAAGDVHPNPTGSKAMAQAVWAKAKQDCVAQPASSGCCAP